jgi:nitroimidazol reductase NimA-like FMN-containing flavoprotein (pyridoxamine 5'-phosphate oxidase superfamily)
MLGKLNSSEIDEVIHDQLIARVGCHADGMTYVVPVSYAYDGECIYVHSQEGLKIDMMRRNPEVCVQIDQFFDMANWRSVIAWGRFEELLEKKEREYGLGRLVNRVLPFASSETTHLSPYWPFPPRDLQSIKGIVFRIRLVKKTGRFEHTVPASVFAS